MIPLGVLTYNSENIGNFERDQAFSIEVWFYQTSNKTAALVSHIDAAKRGWLIQTWSGRNVGMVLSNTDPGNFINVRTGLNQYSLNVWNHIVFTYNGSSLASGVKCYLNNSLKALSVVFNNLTATIKSDNAKLWCGHSAVYPFFPGSLDEIVIYDRVLGAAEIGQRYNGGAGLENLIGPAYLQYHLNELSGDVVTDSSGFGRSGKTINNPSWIAGKLNNCLSLNGSSQYVEA